MRRCKRKPPLLGDSLLALLQRFKNHRPSKLDEDEGQYSERYEHPNKGAYTGVNQWVIHDFCLSG